MVSSEVTARLGIQPTHTHEVGDARAGVGTPFREAMWSLSSEGVGHGPLAEHLAVLLDAVEPQQQVLTDLADEGYTLDWFCYVSVHGNSGVSLPPELLRRLAALPVLLDLDIYG
jgi:hypothetical protein